MKLYQCPVCPALLQRVNPGSSYEDKGRQALVAVGVHVPGPAAQPFIALAAHQVVCHPELDTHRFLEAYLSK